MIISNRPRRLRTTPAMRRLVAQTTLTTNDLVLPLFVREGLSSPVEISSLPGVFQHCLDSLYAEVESAISLGIPGIILFGIPQEKDDIGSGGFDEKGIVQLALGGLRARFGNDVVLMADLCVDEYTSHGHCGVLDANGVVDNDATLEIYSKCALAQAHAGAHIVAPSGMMDGQVGVIRNSLEENGFNDTGILAYSAKYASGLYGPFRDAVNVSIAGGGNRKGYQQDWANARESILEVDLDIEQGADMVMVKPAMTYLDIVRAVSQRVDVPVAAYHVSGEYAMIKAAAANGWIDEQTVVLEQMTAIKRAGADIILTYYADFVARLL